MKVATGEPAGLRAHAIHAIVLLLLTGLLYATTRAVPGIHSSGGTIAAIGFLLLSGTLASELVEPLGLPHLSGYIGAGIIAGPHVLNLADHHAVEDLSSVNDVAVALIALAGGSQLRMEMLRRGLRSVCLHHVLQLAIVAPVMVGVFYAARPLVPHASGLPVAAALGVALLWGAFSMARSSAATLGILSQTRATGPIARHTLAFIMTSDILAITLSACALAAARPLLDPSASISMHELEELGKKLLGSVSIGTTLGLALAAYLRIIGRQLVLVFAALGLGATYVLRYLHFEAPLVFMVAGFVVMNLSKQGEKLIRAIEDAASVVFVIFFARAGAHLDVPLLRQMWPVALLLNGSRAVCSVVAARLGSRAGGDPPILRRWAWSGLVSQAGLALVLGLALAPAVEQAYPGAGASFRALVVACVALNEVIGPILFKLALDRGGETGVEEERGARTSLPSPPSA